METNENVTDLNPQASLKMIYQMIESTKAKIGRNYFYYLFWGYLVTATCLLDIALIQIGYEKHYLVWPVLMLAGTIVTLIFYIRSARTETSKTYIGTAMMYLFAGWGITLIVLLVFLNLRQDFKLIIPVIMAMDALAIFVAGGIVSFRPLIIGALLSWIGAVVSYFMPYQVQLVIFAGVLILSYIVPGHILRNKSKSN